MCVVFGPLSSLGMRLLRPSMLLARVSSNVDGLALPAAFRTPIRHPVFAQMVGYLAQTAGRLKLPVVAMAIELSR